MLHHRKQVSFMCLIVFFHVFLISPQVQGQTRDPDSANDGAKALAGILAGAGIGVIATGFVLGESNLVVSSSDGYKEFDSDKLVFTGAILVGIGALIAAISFSYGGKPSGSGSDSIETEAGLQSGSWDVTLIQGCASEVGLGFKTSF